MHSNRQEYLISLVESTIPTQDLPDGLPSLEHCIGTNRLLGERYVEATKELLKPTLNPQLTTKLEELAVLLRSFVVVEDYKKDNNLRAEINCYINKWLFNIEILILQKVSALGGEPILWNKYYKRYQRAYDEFCLGSPYHKVLDKCGFVFMPLDLPIFSGSKNLGIVRHLLGEYLFTLQLIDDFRDIDTGWTVLVAVGAGGALEQRFDELVV